MKLRVPYAALLFIAVSCHGQQAPTSDSAPADTPAVCPVSIVNINPTGSDSFGHAFGSKDAHANDNRMFILNVHNNAGKDIKGMKFQAAYYDAIEDLTPIPVAWEWTDPLKAGDEKSFRWENSWRNESKVGWNVKLTKVLFQDGTKWEAAPGQTCSSDYWRDKHHR